MTEYRTNDIWLVATLLTYGMSYKSLETRDGSDKLWFIYEKNKHLDDAVASHYAGMLNIPSLQMKANYSQTLEYVKQESRARLGDGNQPNN